MEEHMAKIITEADLNAPQGVSLQRLSLDIPTEWTALDEACKLVERAGHANGQADAQQAIERGTQFGLLEWRPDGYGYRPGLYVRRAEVVYRTERERMLLAGRVYHTDSQGETTAFNFNPDDPLYRLRRTTKPRWTAAEKAARDEAEKAGAKRSKPNRLKKLIGR
jgi:hypothetical protein